MEFYNHFIEFKNEVKKKNKNKDVEVIKQDENTKVVGRRKKTT